MHKISADLPPAHAAFVEPLSCALHAVERANLTFDDVVVVAGCGPIGLGMIAGARAKYPAKIVALDLAPDKLALALECGADIAINIGKEDAVAAVKEITGGYGADVYLEGTGHPSAVAQGLNLLRKLGTYVEYSVFGSDVSVDWSIISDDKELDVLRSPPRPAHLAGRGPDARVRRAADGQDLHPPAPARRLPAGSGSGGQRQGVGEGVAHPVSAIGRSIDPADRPVWIGTSWKMTKTLARGPGLRRPGRGRANTGWGGAVRAPARTPPWPRSANGYRGSRRSCSEPRTPTGQPEGAWTGEISMAMAADAGATMVEMGHSERRELFGETDETVAAKAAAAVQHGLVPLICVGEPLAVRDAGQAENFVAGQVLAALSRLAASGVAAALVAYEPVWAIGEHGRPATETEVAPVMTAIVDTVAGFTGGGALRGLLYGGSVNLDNAATLLSNPHTDGLFVGRSAWQPDGFTRLLRIGGRHRTTRTRQF